MILRSFRFFPTLPKFSKPYFHDQRQSHFSINGEPIDFFDCLLRHCAGSSDGNLSVERPVKQIHSQIILTYSSFSAFISARLISMYAKLALLKDARKVFDTCLHDCSYSALFWNSMLRAYVSCFMYEDALGVYRLMRELNDAHPDGFGFPLIIKACGMRGDFGLCEKVHCQVIQMGLAKNLHVSHELIGMYGELGRTQVASQVFDQMPLRSHISWNVMISVYAKNNEWESAFRTFHRMENEGWVPNSVTFTSLISSFSRCGLVDKTWEFYAMMREKRVDFTAESLAVVISVCIGMPVKGEILHGHVITSGFEKYIFVRNALITFYGRSGSVEKVEHLFSGLESKSIISWNALISAYAQSGFCDEAYSAFLRLKNSDNLKLRPNVVTWTAVINVFAATGQDKEMTLELFRQMQFTQVLENAVTIASMLSVCAELSALPLGREIHAHSIRKWMDSDILVTNGLINMYMKCGSLRTGNSIFEQMSFRDVTSWNIMITGFGMHGLGNMALEIFKKMLSFEFKPDGITFVAALSACSHSGLVSKGQEIFNRMVAEFGIEPQVEHYSCMVDLFGRAGLLKEAEEVLKSMPMDPNGPVWGALLNSCKVHGSVILAEETAARIFNMDGKGTGGYMLLSNLYASDERWDESANVRMRARERGLKKVPGQSWIEVKKKVYSFSAGEDLCLDMEEVYGVLGDLKLQMVGMESCVTEGLVDAKEEYGH